MSNKEKDETIAKRNVGHLDKEGVGEPFEWSKAKPRL